MALITENTLALPNVGDNRLNIINKNTIELVRVVGKKTTADKVDGFDFVNNGVFMAPNANDINIIIDDISPSLVIKSISFRRRPLYTNPKQRDLRIISYLTITTVADILDGNKVTVTNPNNNLWPSTMVFETIKSSSRRNEAIHVPHLGYHPDYQKLFMVGYWIGDKEIDLSYLTNFDIIDSNNNIVYTGKLSSRAEFGFQFTPNQYQSVLQGDFSDFKTEGKYKIQIGDLGQSFEFVINKNVFLNFARNMALGCLHQKSGYKIGLSYSRFFKNADHTKAAWIPIPESNFTKSWGMIQSESNGIMTNNATLLFPYPTNINSIDVSNHFLDAGDYSNYMISMGHSVHSFVFAADNLNNNIDNLNLPESNNQINDLLELADWEAQGILKLQDVMSGGFYTFVYPKDRPYELDVSLRENSYGDDQFVAPISIWATGIAVGALAEIASSPLFIKQFGQSAADKYLNAALKGWAFIMGAINKYGLDKAHQHLRNMPLDQYECLVYAASALFVATNDQQYNQSLLKWLPDPNKTPWQWNWKVMDGYYGCALRCYAFAVKSGRRQINDLNANYLSACQNQITIAGDKAVYDASINSYGVSYAYEDKSFSGAQVGWFFPQSRFIDLATAYKINNDIKYLNTLISNINFIVGCNPVNISTAAGLGYKRLRTYVNQYKMNDVPYHNYPPNGIPKAAISNGVGLLEIYTSPDGTNELLNLVYPADYDFNNKYFIYHRLESDCYNVSDEITSTALVLNRGLAGLSILLS